jgi:hypothetical protein
MADRQSLLVDVLLWILTLVLLLGAFFYYFYGRLNRTRVALSEFWG